MLINERLLFRAVPGEDTMIVMLVLNALVHHAEVLLVGICIADLGVIRCTI